MHAFLAWILLVLAGAMLSLPKTHNAGCLALAGSVLGLLVHYGIAVVPEVLYLAVVFWVVAIALVVATVRASSRKAIL